MNDSKIKVLLVEPEKYPKEIVIDDSLEAMQEVVGGDIEEYMPFDDDVAIICNEEGKMRGLPLNRAVYVQDNDKKEMVDIICGKFFICYAPPESESFQSLPDDMMKKYKEQFKYPERFSKEVGGNPEEMFNLSEQTIWINTVSQTVKGSLGVAPNTP